MQETSVYYTQNQIEGKQILKIVNDMHFQFEV